MKAKYLLIVILLVAPLFLSGCVGDWMSLVCDISPDSDHCFQGAGAQEGDTSECDKIKGDKFKDGGSNPPRDKCYMMVAENTGNLDACKKIKGGFMSYTQDECILNSAIKNENPSGCKLLFSSSATECRSQLGKSIDATKVVEVDKQIEDLKEYLKNGDDPELKKQLEGLETKRADMLTVLTADNKKEYEKLSDPISQEIIGDFAVGDIDSGLKSKLLEFNQKLKDNGTKMTMEQYNSIRDYLAYINDPKNDIEEMDDKAIVKDRWNEKVGNAVDVLKIWKTKTTESEQKWDEQLRFYERMLERQKAIDGGLTELQQDFNRNMEMINNAMGDKIKDEVKDKIIEGIFGEITGKTVGWATKPIEEALDTVKAEAKSMEFRGLARAYDLGMAEELGKFGGDVDKAHAEVIKKMSANAYEYEDGNPYAKYGNVLENKDCDGTNPHCVNREVFWKAMKKSYEYQNKAK